MRVCAVRRQFQEIYSKAPSFPKYKGGDLSNMIFLKPRALCYVQLFEMI